MICTDFDISKVYPSSLFLRSSVSLEISFFILHFTEVMKKGGNDYLQIIAFK